MPAPQAQVPSAIFVSFIKRLFLHRKYTKQIPDVGFTKNTRTFTICMDTHIQLFDFSNYTYEPATEIVELRGQKAEKLIGKL
jgi:hypothetical protein